MSVHTLVRDVQDVSTDALKSAESNPLIIYLVLGGLALGVISTLLLPNLRQLMNNWRTIAAEKDDAERRLLQEKLDRVLAMQEENRDRQMEHDRVLTIHRQWDLQVMEDPSHARMHPAPPLYPTRLVLERQTGERP